MRLPRRTVRRSSQPQVLWEPTLQSALDVVHGSIASWAISAGAANERKRRNCATGCRHGATAGERYENRGGL